MKIITYIIIIIILVILITPKYSKVRTCLILKERVLCKEKLGKTAITIPLIDLETYKCNNKSLYNTRGNNGINFRHTEKDLIECEN